MRGTCTLLRPNDILVSIVHLLSSYYHYEKLPSSNRSASPWTNSLDPLNLNARNEPSWRIVHGWELHTGSYVDFSQSLQQLGRSTFFDVSLTIKDSILGKPHDTLCVRLKRNRHAWIVAYVLDFAVF